MTRRGLKSTVRSSRSGAREPGLRETGRSACRAIGALASLLALLATGCSIYEEGVGIDGVRRQNGLKVYLEQANFRVVESHVEGSASCPHILWISLSLRPIGIDATVPPWGIPLSNPHLHEQAMADLHTRVDLRGPRLLINVREELKVTSYLGLFATVRLTITADVVEFVRGEEEVVAWRR